MTSYDPDSRSTTAALSRLEGVGIPVITFLNVSVRLLQRVLNTFVPNVYIYADTKSLLNAWSSPGASSDLPPTWNNLLLIIHHLNLHDLALKMETYLSGATKEYTPIARKGEEI